jgi:hypothetical protein
MTNGISLFKQNYLHMCNQELGLFFWQTKMNQVNTSHNVKVFWKSKCQILEPKINFSVLFLANQYYAKSDKPIWIFNVKSWGKNMNLAIWHTFHRFISWMSCKNCNLYRLWLYECKLSFYFQKNIVSGRKIKVYSLLKIEQAHYLFTSRRFIWTTHLYYSNIQIIAIILILKTIPGNLVKKWDVNDLVSKSVWIPRLNPTNKKIQLRNFFWKSWKFGTC